MNTLAKRFYETACVSDDGLGVRLDARSLRTPGGAVFSAPTPALAAAIAEEWNAQTDHIAPSRMPLTQFAFAAIDQTPNRRADLVTHVLKYAETDLCCHRAAAPAALAARQAERWDPIVAWCASTLGAAPPVVTGVVAAPIDAAVMDAVRRKAEGMDDFHLTALAQATGLAGSALIGLALTQGAIDAQTAYAAAALDDVWSLETWGEDAEARARLERQRAEFEALARFVAALG